MSKLSRGDVEHVARLANLHLNESEVKKFTSQLSQIIEYIGQLQMVNTQDVEPTSQTTGKTNTVRSDDKPMGSLPVELATSETDQIYNDYFLVDAVLEKDKNDL